MSLKDIPYKIDSSDKTKYFIGITTLLIGVCGFLYKLGVDNGSNILIAIGTIGFFILVALLFLIYLILVFGSVKAIKLKLNTVTGHLFDDNLGARNVSLRAKSINIILDTMEKNQLYDAGKNVGGDFYDFFIDKEQQRGNEDLTANKILECWQKYDSSSGMGIFEISGAGLETRVKIKNPFTGECKTGHENKKCEFLRGYIEGFLNKVYRKSINVNCAVAINDKSCIFNISEKSNHTMSTTI